MTESHDAGQPTQPLSLRRRAVIVAVALAVGVATVLFPYLAAWLIAVAQGAAPASITSVSGYTLGLTLLFPLTQGIALGLGVGGRSRQVGVTGSLILALTGIELLAAFVFMHEGIICLIIIAPLVLGMTALGALLGRGLSRLSTPRALRVSLMPLIALAVFAEASGPAPNYAASVTDSVVINAPPEYVWRYVVQYPENQTASEYWLWNIGLPRPIQSVADAPQVGATRLCRFSNDIAFEERIIELEPNRVMTFDVTRQPDHPEVIGHFQFDRGQIQLTPSADGASTTITATSWYRLFVRPAGYFDWWTADITRAVHFRVLNHMKRLAEADYARDQASAH